MPVPKAAFDALFSYEVYEPAEILDPDLMYTVAEVARLLQDLDPDVDLDPETEERVIAWTVPWLFHHRESLVISDPTGDEPGYFGLRAPDSDAAAEPGRDPAAERDPDREQE